ncbi:MAG: helix-hairpin-helix domain-containing protein [Planctomycetes bacterium]|nr:helix-hairpin-helix domain-containing protein [Planctomycetota bacterium]
MERNREPIWVLALVGWMTFDAGRRLGIAFETRRSATVSASSGKPTRPAVDLETSTARALRALPGVGEVRALALVAARWRDPARPLLERLDELEGFGPVTAQRIRDAVSSQPGSAAAPSARSVGAAPVLPSQRFSSPFVSSPPCSGPSFSGPSLSGSSLSGASLSGASLSGASLSGASNSSRALRTGPSAGGDAGREAGGSRTRSPP